MKCIVKTVNSLFILLKMILTKGNGRANLPPTLGALASVLYKANGKRFTISRSSLSSVNKKDHIKI